MKNNKLIFGLIAGAVLYFVFRDKNGDKNTRLNGDTDESLRQELDTALAELELAMTSLSVAQGSVANMQSEIADKDIIIAEQLTEITDLQAQIDHNNGIRKTLQIARVIDDIAHLRF